MLLVYLTVAAAAVLVLVLAGYLIAIAWALIQARRNVAELASTLETIADATVALPRSIEETDAAVAALVEVLPKEDTGSSRIATPTDRHAPADET